MSLGQTCHSLFAVALTATSQSRLIKVETLCAFDHHEGRAKITKKTAAVLKFPTKLGHLNGVSILHATVCR
jgi:hypothetical protein